MHDFDGKNVRALQTLHAASKQSRITRTANIKILAYYFRESSRTSNIVNEAKFKR